MIVVSIVLRLVIGGLLAWWLAVTIAAPDMPRLAAAVAVTILVATFWRAEAGFLTALATAPAGVLFAAPPARAAEMFAWAFLGAWLLSVWRPLVPAHRPGIIIPAALYGLTVVGSWLALSLGASAGVDPAALPRFLLWLIPPDHLVWSSPQTETWTMLQAITGIGIFLAAAGLSWRSAHLVRRTAIVLAVSLAVLGIASLVDIALQWRDAGYGTPFLARYLRGERFAIHMADWNAAGSLYLLGGVTAAVLAIADHRRRPLWTTVLLAIVPAFLLTGSISAQAAALAAAALVAVLMARRRAWHVTRAQIAAAAAAVLVVSLAAAVFAARRAEGRASAAEAVSMRAQFMEASARMFASAPVFGVGTGRYYDRSAEFMPAELRNFYGNENAHNYFAQQFAELGVIGGALFLWLVAAVLLYGWRSARAPDAGPAILGLFGGSVGYLLTALTGHPLLVSEAAIPFWGAFGVVAGSGSTIGGAPARRLVYGTAIALVAVGLLVNISDAARAAAAATTPPAEQGFHGMETARSGRQFRWTTRHAVSYIPDGPGILRLRVSAPDNRPLVRPVEVEVLLAGRPVARRILDSPEWVRIDVSVRDAGAGPFRRLDLRAGQVWMEDVSLGERAATRPVSLMVESIVWVPVS